jgi:hypothetical protein
MRRAPEQRYKLIKPIAQFGSMTASVNARQDPSLASTEYHAAKPRSVLAIGLSAYTGAHQPNNAIIAHQDEHDGLRVIPAPLGGQKGRGTGDNSLNAALQTQLATACDGCLACAPAFRLVCSGYAVAHNCTSWRREQDRVEQPRSYCSRASRISTSCIRAALVKLSLLISKRTSVA